MTPFETYTKRRAERQKTADALEARANQIANARLVVFVAAVGLAWAAYSQPFSFWTLVAPGSLFLVLVVVHDQALRRLARARRAVAYYDTALARLQDEWMGKGQGGAELSPPDHPYAADLDLFGPGSLFERLNQARTRGGEEALAGWLLAPATAAEATARQAAVVEWREKLDLRESLALEGDDVRARISPGLLTRWGEAPSAQLPSWLRPVAIGVGIYGLVALALWGEGLGLVPLASALVLDWVVLRLAQEGLERATAQVTSAGAHLQLLSALLKRLEVESVAAPRLQGLLQSMSADGVKASEQIARLNTWVDRYETRQNQFFAPIAFLTLWSAHCALAIEAWRQACGPKLGAWLHALSEAEALAGLASYAYECPNDPFPELLPADAAGGPLYEADALGHPLLPASKCVRNEVRLGGELRLLLVSGSNMSGKSTYMRTIGINAVLAQAGAPVRAKRMRLSTVAIGATLRVQDSLAEGASRFYAEITRLKQVIDLAGKQPPLLFLLDEVLAGTNSHDRLQGAEALIRALVSKGAIGVVTTHDLALARAADDLKPRARNAHFADDVVNGQLSFDYTLREGVVTRSNAIALMRAVGLPLD